MAQETGKNDGFLLLLDDDKGTCELEAQRLAPLGLELRRAYDIPSAMAALETGTPRLMLVDYSLPGANALELLQLIKKSGRQAPPFLVVTGRGDEAVAVEAMKAGALDYLIKTSDFLDSLLPAVRKALDKASLQAELASAQAATRKNLRLYTVLAQINQAAAKKPGRKELLQAACDIAASSGGMMLAWVGLPDKDTGRLRPVCLAGSEQDYLKGLRIDLTEGPYSLSPMGRAVLKGKICTSMDIPADHSFDPWRERVAKAGFKSSAAIPLLEGGRVTAVLGLYSSETDFFSGDELKLLTEIQADLSLALEAMTDAEKRAEAQAALERTAAQLAHVMEANPVLLFKLKKAGTAFITEWVSGNSAAVLGYEAAEILRPGWLASVLHPDDKEAVLKAKATLAEKGSLNMDYRVRARNGKYIWVHGQLKTLNREEAIGSWTDITQLKESEARFQELFEKAPVGYQSLDEKGNLLAVNDTWLETFGYPKEEVVGHNYGDFLAQDYRKTFSENFPKFKAAGKISGVEFEVVRKDGGTRHIVFNGRVARNPDGSFKQTHCVFTDVTATWKEARQRKILTEAIKASSNEIYVFDAATFRFIFANHGAMSNLGYSQKELEGMTPWDIKSEFTERSFREAAAPLAGKDGRVLVFESLHRRKDGTTYPVEVRMQHVAIPTGPVFLAVVTDITERRRAEAELTRQRKLLTDVMDNSDSFIYATDLEGRFIIANRALASTLGTTPEKMIGRTRLDFMPEETAAQHKGNDLKILKNGKPLWTEETAPVGKELRSFYSSKFPLVDASGRIYAVCGISYDISERKKNERLLAEMANMQRVESLGALAGGIAHDFNNMLTGIMANLSLMSARLRDGQNADILHDTLEAARSAQVLTQQLMAFAKGGKPVKKEFCLGRSLKEIFNLATRGTSCSHELDLQKDLWSVDGDEGQIKQAVNNLLVNAIQAMPSGGTLTLAAANLRLETEKGALPAGNYIKLTVSDTGIGIPKEYLPRIFEPYFTTKSQGHGLGLPMTWSVVKNHGGHIEAASEPGKGTSFELLLPATGRSLAPERDQAHAAVKGTGRILLLEDEQLLQKAAVRMLKELGYAPEVTTEGRATLKAYMAALECGAPFAAVIMDLTIPGGMGGKEAVAELRKLHPAARVIVSSGYSDEAVMADYKAYGFDAVLPKPYTYEQMAETLAKVLG